MLKYSVLCSLLVLTFSSCTSDTVNKSNNSKTKDLKDTLSFESVMDDLAKHNFSNLKFYDTENNLINGIVGDTFTMKISFKGKFQRMLNEARTEVKCRTNNMKILEKIDNQQYKIFVDKKLKQNDFRFELIIKPINTLLKKQNPDSTYKLRESLGTYYVVNLY